MHYLNTIHLIPQMNQFHYYTKIQKHNLVTIYTIKKFTKDGSGWGIQVTYRVVPVRCSGFWSSWWPVLLWTGGKARWACGHCVCWHRRLWTFGSSSPTASEETDNGFRRTLKRPKTSDLHTNTFTSLPQMAERKCRTAEKAMNPSSTPGCWSPLENNTAFRSTNHSIWYGSRAERSSSLQSKGSEFVRCFLNCSLRSLLTPMSWNMRWSFDVYSKPHAC